MSTQVVVEVQLKTHVYAWYINEHMVDTGGSFVANVEPGERPGMSPAPPPEPSEHAFDEEDRSSIMSPIVDTPAVLVREEMESEPIYLRPSDQMIAVGLRTFYRLFEHPLVRQACVDKLSVSCDPFEKKEYNITLDNPRIYLKTQSQVARSNSFDKCAICTRLMQQRIQAAKEKDRGKMKSLVGLMQQHMRSQRQSRTLYYQHQRHAREDPTRALCIIFDEMDGAKTEQPYIGINARSKEFSQLERYK